MIGNTYKKFAQENGLTVSNGVAYGSLRGYAASLFEGSGWKAVVLSVRFSDPARRVELMDLVGNMGDRQLYKTYRVNRDDGFYILATFQNGELIRFEERELTPAWQQQRLMDPNNR